MENFENKLETVSNGLTKQIASRATPSVKPEEEIASRDTPSVKPEDGSSGKSEQGGVRGIPAKVKETVKELINGRKDYPADQQRIIDKYGDRKITNIKIGRTPLPKFITATLNIVTLGQFDKIIGRSDYDDLYHLFSIITLSDGTQVKILLEKNDAINMKVVSSYNPKGAEYIDIDVSKDITFADLLNGGRKVQGDKFFKYNATHNNCQDFILALLRGSSIATAEATAFIKQDVKSLFKNLPKTKKFINSVTSLGGAVDIIKKKVTGKK
jgi:hypothetical protein